MMPYILWKLHSHIHGLIIPLFPREVFSSGQESPQWRPRRAESSLNFSFFGNRTRARPVSCIHEQQLLKMLANLNCKKDFYVKLTVILTRNLSIVTRASIGHLPPPEFRAD